MLYVNHRGGKGKKRKKKYVLQEGVLDIRGKDTRAT